MLLQAMYVCTSSAIPSHPAILLFSQHVPLSLHYHTLIDSRHAQGEDALRAGEWVLSDDPKYEGQESRVRVEPCSLEGGRFAGDYGLLLSESHKHYAVGASLPKPVDNAGKVSAFCFPGSL